MSFPPTNAIKLNYYHFSKSTPSLSQFLTLPLMIYQCVNPLSATMLSTTPILTFPPQLFFIAWSFDLCIYIFHAETGVAYEINLP